MDLSRLLMLRLRRRVCSNKERYLRIMQREEGVLRSFRKLVSGIQLGRLMLSAPVLVVQNPLKVHVEVKAVSGEAAARGVSDSVGLENWATMALAKIYQIIRSASTYICSCKKKQQRERHGLRRLENWHQKVSVAVRSPILLHMLMYSQPVSSLQLSQCLLAPFQQRWLDSA